MQVSDTEKSLPCTVRSVIAAALSELLVISSALPGLSVPTGCGSKSSRLLTPSVRGGIVTTPVPSSLTLAGEFEASLVTCSKPSRIPVAVGWKRTANRHAAPGASAAPQSWFSVAASPCAPVRATKSPLASMARMFSIALPGFTPALFTR